jgi:magnesium-transporting ATPase (P-type)
MENQTSQPSRFVKWSLIVGIIIVINMFFNYAISLVYKAPEYPNNQTQVIGNLYTKESCLSVGGQWTANPPEIKPADPQGKYYSGYCNPDYTKQMQYEQDRKTYERTVFIILFVLGALILILGTILKQEVLAIALSWGGVLSLVIASMRYWSNANNAFKVAILAVALIVLMWLAIRKFAK